jgi:plasmid stabilization system protein ParE
VVPLSPTARADLRALIAHYEAKDRLEAAESLLVAVTSAQARILRPRGMVYDAPRPYPELKRLGFLWIIERHYWVAYEDKPPLITAIFHETADIPGWY